MKHILSLIILSTIVFVANGQNNIVYQSPIDPSTRQIDKNLAVGTVAGGASVGSNGAVTYSIPVFVSPGTAGLQPNIALVYNSMAGNGIAGQGWNISGLSSISRVASTIYHDGVVDPADMDANDRFVLDGNRLIGISGTYGAGGAEYRNEMESFQKIISYDDNSDGKIDWFWVQTKDGVEIEYGRTTGSKAYDLSGGNAVSWFINKIKDKKGNYLTFTYYSNYSTGEFRIGSIDYTGSSTFAPYNSIIFNYSYRNDQIASYNAGAASNNNMALTSIQSFCENNLVHEYKLQYALINNKTRLVEVKEFGKNNSMLNSTLVNWGNTTYSVTENSLAKIPLGKGYHTFTSDYNGDGRKDLVMVDSTLRKWTLYVAQANSTDLTLLSTGNFNTSYISSYSGDFNGDGLDDLMVKTSSIDYKLFICNGAGFGTTYNLSYTLPHVANYGDFDGDGKIDILFMRNIPLGGFNRTLDIYSLGASGGFTSRYINIDSDAIIDLNFYIETYKNRNFVDFNGDGKTDDVFSYTNGLQIGQIGVDNLEPLLFDTRIKKGEYNSMYFGDFNGDGLTDIFTMYPGYWLLSLCSGTSLIHYTILPPFSDYPFYPPNGFKVHIGDVNGDKMSDVVLFTQNENLQKGIWVAYSTDKGFISGFEYKSSNIATINPYNNIFADFDGDGNDELMYYGGLNRMYKYKFADNRNSHYVSSITNGFNNTTAFSYKPLSDASVYTCNQTGSYPLNNLTYPIYLVSSIVTDNGIGGTSQTSYGYSNAKVHVAGRGFLGFLGSTSINSATNMRSESASTVNSQYYIIEPAWGKQYSGTSLIGETSFTNQVTDYTSKRIFPYVKTQIAKAYDLNSHNLYNTVTTTYTYDTDGNLEEELVDMNGIATSKVTNVFGTYGSFCKNRITKTTVLKTRQGQDNFTSVTDFEYYTDGFLKKSIEEPSGPKTRHTEYNYDSNGNITLVKVSPDGVNGRSVTKVYGDTYKRFLTKDITSDSIYVEMEYFPEFGALKRQWDKNNLETSYSYDDFGRLKQTITPDQNLSKVTLSWLTNSDPQYALYYSKAETPGNPPVYVYYDKFGRELRSQKTSLDGTQVYSDIRYNSLGQVDRVTLPYFSGASSFNYKTMEYDNLGRITSEIAPGVNTTYVYDGLSNTITDHIAGQTYTRTSDATGNLVSATDQGGTISYVYYSSGLVKTISAPGKNIDMAYDPFGRQTQLTDPDAGPYSYEYNTYGELVSQKDPQQRTTYLNYNEIGQLKSQTGGTFNINYTYRPNGWLTKVSSSNNVNYTLDYDNLGRVTGKTDSINGVKIISNYLYNDIGQLRQVSYGTSGLSVNYVYQNGYLKELRRGDNNALIWNLNSVNENDQILQSSYGNGLVTSKEYHTIGYLTSINTGNGSIQNLEYHYDGKGLMDWRKDNRRALTESFGYDPLNRLNLIQVNGVTTQNVQYSAAGNIQSKTGVGNYTYDGSQPNALTLVTNPQMLVSPEEQEISYTTFDKVSQITEGAKSSTFTYGPDYQRKMMSTLINGVSSTKYYSDAYEREIKNGVTRDMHYVVAYNDIVAIFEKRSTDTNPVMHYVHTDHLGSLNVITSESGTIEQEMSFDAWGNRRDPSTWQNLTSAPTNLITDRGFTGHEHMDAFKLINMNGRVYDPLLGRFLSADKVIQSPGYTQSFNRFSYVMNNPLMFTDPSGYKAAMNIEINVTTVYDDRGNVIGMRPYNGSVSQYGGGGSLFPMMGVYGGPRNSMEYDIAFAQNVDNVMGGNSNTSAVRENAEWGYYGKDVDGWIFTGNNNEIFRGVIFSDGSQWYVGDQVSSGSLFFTNETDAWRFMELRTKSNNVENLSFFLDKGVLVLPIEGKDYSGKRQLKNAENHSEHDYFNINWDKSTILYNGNWEKFYGALHTHNGWGDGTMSPGDLTFATDYLRGRPFFMLEVKNRTAECVYGMPDGTYNRYDFKFNYGSILSGALKLLPVVNYQVKNGILKTY